VCLSLTTTLCNLSHWLHVTGTGLTGLDIRSGTSVNCCGGGTSVGITSDADCAKKCIDFGSTCTAWVRQPSTNICWLSSQTGSIQFSSKSDRNCGTRMPLGAPELIALQVPSNMCPSPVVSSSLFLSVDTL
jgi:hypothetical protein